MEGIQERRIWLCVKTCHRTALRSPKGPFRKANNMELAAMHKTCSFLERKRPPAFFSPPAKSRTENQYAKQVTCGTPDSCCLLGSFVFTAQMHCSRTCHSVSQCSLQIFELTQTASTATCKRHKTFRAKRGLVRGRWECPRGEVHSPCAYCCSGCQNHFMLDFPVHFGHSIPSSLSFPSPPFYFISYLNWGW